MSTGVSPVNHRTPLAERWGGWYVTGTHGNQTHRGNLIGKEAFEAQAREPNAQGNVTNLAGLFEVSHYPTPHSDIVALMVFEHETHMHNFITRLNYASTLALQQYGHVNYLKSVTEAFLRYMLFTEETPLTAPVRGTSGFAETFSGLGPKDSKGRSLRQFDLQTRLFKYPCSFLIYSEAFDHLPDKMKERIYDRLAEILSGKDASKDFERLTPEIRQEIREILTATKSDLAQRWKAVNTTAAAQGR